MIWSLFKFMGKEICIKKWVARKKSISLSCTLTFLTCSSETFLKNSWKSIFWNLNLLISTLKYWFCQVFWGMYSELLISFAFFRRFFWILKKRSECWVTLPSCRAKVIINFGSLSIRLPGTSFPISRHCRNYHKWNFH